MPRCPYCKRKAIRVDSAEVYHGRSYGLIWLCRPCQAWVGCHPTGKALGRLANAELRQLKIRTHAAFDPYWKGGGKRERARAYKALARAIGIEGKDCHIGMFDEAQCHRVILVCEYDLLEFSDSKVETQS